MTADEFKQYVEEVMSRGENLVDDDGTLFNTELARMGPTWWGRYAPELRVYFRGKMFKLIIGSYISSEAWKAKTSKMIAHLGAVCVVCGEQGGKLIIHHKNYTSQFDELAEDVEVVHAHCHKGGNVGSLELNLEGVNG